MKNNMLPLGIYIHIPFCKSKCHYCDFCSSPSNDVVKERYVSALKKEISSFVTVNALKNHAVTSIFFGGGTPTQLPAYALPEILETVFCHYCVSNDAEITVECNPGTVSYEDLQVLRSSGFNRLSLGLQSANDNELKVLGRIHSFRDFDVTYYNARKVGFDNINLDLMYGIPYQTQESFANTLHTVAKYEPEHISSYALKIESGTLFYKERDKLILPDEDCEYNMYKSGIEILNSLGYKHYEISNFAQKGYESRHNLKYWNCDDYVGFGISSHSCLGTCRYKVTSSLSEYLRYFENSEHNNASPYFSLDETLSKEEFAEEYIMMRMRLYDGISINDYFERFGNGFEEKYLKKMMPFINSGHIIYSENGKNVRFSDDGMYVSSYILSEILDLGM